MRDIIITLYFCFRIVRTNWIVNETVSTGLSEREKKKLFASADRHLLELAQISIKSNQYSRLSDLATWASNEKTLDLLIQLAGHYKLVAIVAEIEMIKLNKFKPADMTIISSNTNNSNVSTGNVNTNITVSTTATAWSTPKLPELVAKESPSGILANLTPMKTAGVVTNSAIEPVIVSSPAELASSPTIQANPFAKNNENANPAASAVAPVKDGSAMLDYISAMMKMNESSGNNKRKADDSTNAAKKSALGSNVFTSNAQ